ncbi:MAG: rRNA maturation RNase YbeY [Gammaproteobacteria bacterium]|nr:rRNA maturation RNase YbeY [Gammaproteobacteria bacterium]
MNIDLQLATEDKNIPTIEQFNSWAKTALPEEKQDAEFTIRIVNEQEITELNKRYRNKDSATNILSFPVDLPDEIDLPLLGDIIICASIVNQEAQEQNKTSEEHWAHLTMHGILHLLGYDHDNEQNAKEMEDREIVLLAELGIANPY